MINNNLRGVTPANQNNSTSNTNVVNNMKPKNVFINGDKKNSTPGTYGSNFGVEENIKSFQARNNEKNNKVIPAIIIIAIIILLIFLILVTR